MALDDILSHCPAGSVDAAVALMTAIDERLPDADGLKWFNRLYLRVTVDVRRAIEEASFSDRGFLETLDVVFANLYFSALTQAQTDLAAAPSAWRPLLQARQSPGIARIQFALAGMNAHINRDLPQGIVETFRLMGGDPLTSTARRRDFDAVNDILERVEAQVKVEFAVGLVGVIDQLGGSVDDAIAMWKVRAARSAAWTNSKVLWRLDELPSLRDEFFSRLDGLAGFAGRGLLLPIDERFRR
jgi:hypothetical protein